MKKIILYCLSLAIVVIAAGYVALKTFDPNDYKAEIIEAVKASTGRVLTIGGEMKLNVSFTPTITLSDVSLSNPVWAASEKMAEIGETELQVALLPLMRKKLRIERFLLKDASVGLIVSEDGENNWTFKAPDAVPASPDVPSEPKSESAASSMIRNVEIGAAVFENATLTYSDRQKNKSYTVGFPSLSIREEGGRLVLEAQTNVQGAPVSVSGTFDSMSVLSDGSKPFNASVQADGMGARIVFKGSYEKNARSLTGELRAQGTDVAGLAAAAGIAFPDLKDFEVSAAFSGAGKNVSVPSFSVSVGRADSVLAKVSGRIESLVPLNGAAAQLSVAAPNVAAVKGWEAYTLAPLYVSANASAVGGVYSLNDLSVKASQSDLSGSLSFSETGGAPFVRLKLSSGLINLADLIREKDDTRIISAQTSDMPQTAPVMPNAAQRPQPPAVVKAKAPLFSADPLPFDKLRKANATADIEISKLIAADETDLGAVSLKATLKDGIFTLPAFKVANVLTLSARMDASQGDSARVSSSLRITNLPLTLLFAKKGVSEGIVVADVRFDGQGDSAKKIASSLNGKVLLSVNGLVLKSGLVSDWERFIPDGLTDGKGNLTAQCLVINTPVRNGMLSSDGQIAFEALPLMGQLNANADLGTERLAGELLLASSKPNVWSALTGTAKLSGTLARPRLTMSPQGMLDNAVSYGLAFLVGGKKAAEQTIAVKLKDPCRVALEGGNKKSEKQAQDPVSAADPQAEEMIRSLDGILGRIFGGAQ